MVTSTTDTENCFTTCPVVTDGIIAVTVVSAVESPLAACVSKIFTTYNGDLLVSQANPWSIDHGLACETSRTRDYVAQFLCLKSV